MIGITHLNGEPFSKPSAAPHPRANKKAPLRLNGGIGDNLEHGPLRYLRQTSASPSNSRCDGRHASMVGHLESQSHTGILGPQIRRAASRASL